MSLEKRVWNKKGYGELMGVGVIILLALVLTFTQPLITGLITGNNSLDNLILENVSLDNLSLGNVSVEEIIDNVSVSVIDVEENVSLAEEVVTIITESESVENISLENVSVEDVPINLSEINISLDNLSIEDITENVSMAVIVENVTINVSANITENISINETLKVVENVSVVEENASVVEEVIEGVTIENISLENVTINVSVEEKRVGRVIINRPVKFIKKVKLTAPKKNLIVELPKNASNIEVKKITGKIEKDISDKIVVKKGDKVEWLSEHNLAMLTGGAVTEVGDGLLFRLFNWLKSLFRFTGYIVADDVGNETELVVEEVVDEIEVKYELPGPTSVEEELGGGRKRIIVSSEIHYEDILAYTFIPDSAVESIKLYWIVNKTRQEVNFDGYDTTDDGLVDYIEWIVPHLSNQTYEIEINVLNPIEYLRDGDTWTVMFNTTGTANLSISSNNSYWEEVMVDNSGNVDEMRFLDFKCGDDSLLDVLKIISGDGYVYDYSSIGSDDSIKPVGFLIEDYSCSEIGRFVNHMNIAGYATLIFEFSNQEMTVTDFAYDPSYTYDSCSNITVSGTHEMNASINYYNDTELCFNINASDVVFDCAGYHIDGEYNANYVDTFTAINIDNVTNVTVKNCEITDFTYGIYYDDGSDDGYVFNNSIHLVDSNYTVAGIVSDTADNVLIDSNTVRDIGDGEVGSVGISVSGGTENNVTNNIIYDISGSGIYVEGSRHIIEDNYINDTQSGDIFAAIRLDNCDDGVISSNELIGTSGCDNCNNYGIMLDASSNNNITENIIRNPTDNFVYLHSSSIGNRINNQLFNLTQLGAGVRLASACENNILYNLTIHNSYLDGIEFNDGSNNNNVTDVEIKYNNWSGVSFDDSHNNSFYDVLVTDNQDAGVYFLNSSGNKFIDSTFDDNSLYWGDDADVWIKGASAGANTFVNVSFNESATLFYYSGSGALYVNWYLDVHVNDSNGEVSGANVSAWNVDGGLGFSVLSGGDGWIVKQNISEYYENCSSCDWVVGVKNYLINYTMNTTKSGYDVDSREVNITSNSILYVTMSLLIPTNKKFAITNSSDDIVGSIDDTGNMFILGVLSENQGSLNPGANSFILQDNAGTNIAYVSNTGNLYLVGELTENAVMSVSGTALKFVNASNSLIAFFDNSGNLKLKGNLAQSYGDP